MRRMLILALPVLLFASACDNGGDQITVTSAPQPPSVTVSGHGEVETPSDVGYIDVGVGVTAATVADARDTAATTADAVIAAVKRNGVDAKDIKTQNFSISPQYDYQKPTGGQPTIIGYQVSNIVTVKVRKLDTFSKVVDDATAAGGNNARVNSIRFDVDDTAKALEQARARAMDDAKKKGGELAKLGEVSLGKPISIAETQSTRPPVAMAGAAAADARTASLAPTPIEPGTGTVTVDLTVTWEIKQ